MAVILIIIQILIVTVKLVSVWAKKPMNKWIVKVSI